MDPGRHITSLWVVYISPIHLSNYFLVCALCHSLSAVFPWYVLFCHFTYWFAFPFFLVLVLFCIGGGGGGGYNHISCHPMLSFIQAEHCSDSVPIEKQTLLFLKTVFSKSLVCSPNIWWSMHRKMENKRQWQTDVADEGDEEEKIN